MEYEVKHLSLAWDKCEKHMSHVTYTSQANSKPTLQVVGCNFMVKTQDRLFPNSKLKKVRTRQVFKAKQPNSICFSLKATSEN